MFERPFTAYTYSYPHKTAYRPLGPLPLREVWANESHQALFLYLHIPFCEFRCGFCNLFTHAQPAEGLSTRYLTALRRQAETVRNSIPNAAFAQMAIGGGTPTYLNNDELEDLFSIITDVMGGRPNEVPVSFEASPATIDPEKLALLKQFGVDRLSVGVQSFNHREAHAIGRPEKPDRVRRAMDQLVDADFKTLNVDLIYGGEGQTIPQWIDSVQQAIDYCPEEVFLYPLYVRELTGLGRRGDLIELSSLEQDVWDQQRLAAYREARELLLANGYGQQSLRMFQRIGHQSGPAPIYRCQEDGMVGLGSGARSYTNQLHYSTEYAVNSQAVLGIIHDFIARDARQFSNVDYGFELDEDDQRRRFVILSLLQVEGLCRESYQNRFGHWVANDVLADIPELLDLAAQGMATIDEERIVLTDRGIEYSDAIGPWLYSQTVQSRMEAYECR